MSEHRTTHHLASLPASCTDVRGSGGLPASLLRNPTRKRLEEAKREYIEASLGKGESWCTKVLNNQSGITLDDLPALHDALGLKVVDKSKTCFDPETARAMEHLLRTAMATRSLWTEEAE